MFASTKKKVSVTKANQHFNKVADHATKFGDVVIYKRNKPVFILMDIQTLGPQFIEEYQKLKVKFISETLLNEYLVAYQALAKQ